jgi:hypothetical protein
MPIKCNGPKLFSESVIFVSFELASHQISEYPNSDAFLSMSIQILARERGFSDLG